MSKIKLDITDEVIEFIKARIDTEVKDGDIADLGLYFNRIKKESVEYVHKVALRQHPLRYKHVTSLVTGLDPSTIYRLVDKR